jgi:hypothetical protein
MNIEDKIEELEARIAKLELAHIEDRHIIDTSKPTRFKFDEPFEPNHAIPVVDVGPIDKVMKELK